MPTPRLPRTRADWSKTVAEFEKSGQTQVAFAQERGFHPTTLSYWVRRLRDRDASQLVKPGSRVAPFIELHAEPQVESHLLDPASVDTQVSGARVALSGCMVDHHGTVRFESLPPADYLATLLLKLRGTAC